MVDAALRGASVRPSGTREDMFWLFGCVKVDLGDLLRAYLSSQSCDGADDEVGERQRETASQVGSSLQRLGCSIARFCTGIDSKTCFDATDALYSDSDCASASADLGSPVDENASSEDDRQPVGMRFDQGNADL